MSRPGPTLPGPARPALTTTRNKKRKKRKGKPSRAVSRECVFFRVAAQRQQTERAGEEGREGGGGGGQSPNDAEENVASFPCLAAHLMLPHCN